MENPALGLAIASLPRGFEVVRNEGEVLELVAHTEQGSGQLTFHVDTPVLGGVNLVEAVRNQQAAFEGQPDGEFLGRVELMSPLGSAFTARGRYTTDEGPVEETWVFAVHPQGDRLLSLRYRYPAGGDSKERIDQLLAVLGEVEGITTPDEPS